MTNLRREIIWILAIKLTLIVLIKWFFFSDPLTLDAQQRNTDFFKRPAMHQADQQGNIYFLR